MDKGELDVDCGGPCTPCEDAPSIHVINQLNLEEGKYVALETLKTENEVKLMAGQYTFVSGEEIVLNPGFSIEEGVSFSATVAPKENVTRQFRHTCISMPNVFTPNGDGENDTWNVTLVGAKRIMCEVRAAFSGKLIKTIKKDVDRDGSIPIWDGTNLKGKKADWGDYWIGISVTTYTGEEVVDEKWVHLE
ncbi:MAG: T9SS type B sorting domain-containing protein [Lachnospiraceae bacterium]|nr:T9SS type B sorting domain-containing protein [Lachnospiraceae bacterium]